MYESLLHGAGFEGMKVLWIVTGAWHCVAGSASPWSVARRGTDEDAALVAVETPGLKQPWGQFEARHHVIGLTCREAGKSLVKVGPQLQCRYQPIGDTTATGHHQDSDSCGVEPTWAYQTGCVCCGWKSWRGRATKAFGFLKITSESQMLDTELFILLDFGFTLIWFITVFWFFPLKIRKHITCFWIYRSPQLRVFGLLQRHWTFTVLEILKTGFLKVEL